MKRIRTVGLCLAMACAVGALASASASAETIAPEIGRCVKAAEPAEGLYTTDGRAAK
jgi:hypothetical protein